MFPELHEMSDHLGLIPGLEPDAVRDLALFRAPACVSVYLPAGPGAAGERARIEAKDRLREATEQVRDSPAVAGLAAALEASAAELVEDPVLWRDPGAALAIFISPSGRRVHRLPTAVRGSTRVSDRFHLLPLLGVLAFPHAGWVLALSENAVRLVAVSADGAAEPVRVPQLPESLRGELRLDLTGDRSTLAHLRTSEDPKERLREYSFAIERSVREAVGTSPWPVIIAAAEPLASIYDAVHTQHSRSGGIIAGNPDELSDRELAIAAQPLFDRARSESIAALAAAFREDAPGSRTLAELTAVAVAATEGAIHTLFVDREAAVPGRIDDVTGEVVQQSASVANYDIVDEIARRAMHSGARVLAVRGDEMPAAGPVAAILRYAPGRPGADDGRAK